jgi:hypothetical protein
MSFAKHICTEIQLVEEVPSKSNIDNVLFLR